MKKLYIVECRVDTYATAEILANSPEEAIDIAKGFKKGNQEDVDWFPATDWDSSTDFEVIDELEIE